MTMNWPRAGERRFNEVTPNPWLQHPLFFSFFPMALAMVPSSALVAPDKRVVPQSKESTSALLDRIRNEAFARERTGGGRGAR